MSYLAHSMRYLLELLGEVLGLIGRTQSQKKIDRRVVPWNALLLILKLGDYLRHATLEKAGYLLTKSLVANFLIVKFN